jgi:SagB-type dehydrogenase family enzyme
MSKKVFLVGMLLIGTAYAYSQTRVAHVTAGQTAKSVEGNDIILKEVHDGGIPLMEALKMRKTTRSFAARPLELHILSELLWAANGINRPEEGKHTAPSARNAQEIDIYVVMEEGIYRYVPDKNLLQFLTQGDHRSKCLTPNSSFALKAPVILVMVANAEKMNKLFKPEQQDHYSAIDCGYISQNIYLYAASQKLATVAMGQFENEFIKNILKLRDDKIVLIQPVGFVE